MAPTTDDPGERPEDDTPEDAAQDSPHDSPQDTPHDTPAGRPPMGFSSPGSPPPARREEPSDADAGMPDLGALLRGLSGNGPLPDMGQLEAMMRQLGGAGGLPDMAQLEAMMRQLGVTAPGPGQAPMGAFAVLQQQLQQMFTPQTSESRAAMATDVARKTVAAAGSDPAVTPAQAREVAEAVQVAHLWVDPMTAFDAPTGQGVAWSRAQWVESTMPTWTELVEPVAAGVTRAVTAALQEQLGKLGESLGENPQGLSGLPGLEGLQGLGGLENLDLGGLMKQVAPAMEQMAGTMFSAQLGHGVGALAGDVLSGTEVGLPLVRSEDVALLPANVDAFTEGLGIDRGEVRLYLAVREAARARLFAEVPWLGPQLEAAVRDYAAQIRIDTDAIEEEIRGMEPEQGMQGFAELQEKLRDRLFSPTPTPQQQAALARLETSLALVEGWVDLVTDQAVAGHLPQAAALGEAVRRRRAGGPAQKAFAGLVGLELRPRRLRDARNLWAALEDAGGLGLRDGAWSHPDIAPTAADLDDPLGYVEKRQGRGAAQQRDEMDEALEQLLRESEGDQG